MTLATQFLNHLPFVDIPRVAFSDKGTSLTTNIYVAGSVTGSKMAASLSGNVVAVKSVIICCESTSENSNIDSFNDSSTDHSMSEYLSSVTCVYSDVNELSQSETGV